MVKRVNLNDGPEQREAKRFQALESQSPVGSTSITKPSGRLRVASQNGILAQQVPGGGPAINVTGLQLVEGTLRIEGTLEGVGSWVWTGPWTLAGDGDITGDVDITGILTLMSELIVATGGKITVGGMVIDPTGGGSVKFPGGDVVRAGSGGGIEVVSGSYRTVITSTGASIGSTGRAMTAHGSGFQFTGLPTIARASANTAVVGTVWSDALGNIFRVI